MTWAQRWGPAGIRRSGGVSCVHANDVVGAVGHGIGVAAYEISRGIERWDDDEGLAGFLADGDLHGRGVARSVDAVTGVMGGHVVSAAREALGCGVRHGASAAECEVVQTLGRGGWADEGGDKGKIAGGSAGSSVGRNRDVYGHVFGRAVFDSCGRRQREGGDGADAGRGAPSGCEISYIDGAETGGHVVAGCRRPSLGSCVGRVDEHAIAAGDAGATVR